VKQIDLDPGEYAVVDIAAPLAGERDFGRVTGPFEQLARSLREMRLAFATASSIFAGSRLPTGFRARRLEERHHMQFIERHIRRTRRPKK